MPSPPARLKALRHLIDAVDDGLVLLFAGRRHLVGAAARAKDAAGIAAADHPRERSVRVRARRLGNALGVPPDSSDRLAGALIADARRQQGLPVPADTHCDAGDDRSENTMPTPPPHAWLRWLPPPRRWAPLLRWMPGAAQARLLETVFAQVLRAPLDQGALDLLEGRRIGIEVVDLGLRWVLSVRQRRLHVAASGDAEASVRGDAVDLLLLASRREDADTLFFQRRLVVTGDVELGLTARNLLDQLPWQDVPLAQRIVLHRAAGWAQAARTAWRGT